MILDGKQIASKIHLEIGNAIQKLKGRKPGLAFVLIGDHPPSQSYIKAKQKACKEVGILSLLVELPISISQKELLSQLCNLNQDPAIDGILVQLPLPTHLNEQIIASAIDPSKDVDGFHPLNVGKMLLGQEDGFLPCTPYGIKVLLERSQIPIEGKHVVIVGRSNIVGKPLAAILVQKKPHCNATVTMTHSHSQNLSNITATADILIAAIGKAHFITKKMVRQGSVVIDVGINRLPDGKLVGDVDFEEVSKIASHITPVPGGIGPMTIAMLLQNTLTSYLKKNAKNDLL